MAKPQTRPNTHKLQKVTETITRLATNQASHQLHQFVKCLDGESHRSIADKLETTLADRPSKSVKALVDLLRKESKCSLGTLLIAAKADLSSVIRRYTTASLEMGQNLTMIEFAKAMPQATRDLMRHAAVEEGLCWTCMGAGKVPKKGQEGTEEACPLCYGKGRRLNSPEHFEYAVDTGLKALKILEPAKGATVNVNQQVGVKVEGGGLFEKIVAYADHAKGPERILDVFAEPSKPEPSEPREAPRDTP